MPENHQTGTYYEEHEHDDVNGFAIINDREGEVHVAEKWLRPEDEGGDKWLDYWMSVEDLNRRVEEGACEKKAELTDEQYAAVCENVGWYEDTSAEPTEVTA